MYIFIGIFVGLVLASIILNYVLLESSHLEPVPCDNDLKVGGSRIDTAGKKLLESIYFTTSTWSTTGCPDILPVTPMGKLAVSIQNVFIIALAVGVLKVSIDNAKNLKK